MASYQLYINNSPARLADNNEQRAEARLERLTQSYQNPCELQFGWYGDSRLLGAKVKLTVDGTTRFDGWAYERRVPSDLGQRDTYICLDAKEKAREVVIENTETAYPAWTFNDESVSNILSGLLASDSGAAVRARGACSGFSGAPSEKIPFIELRNMSFAAAVEAVCNTIPGTVSLVDPATQTWKIINIFDAPATPITLGSDWVISDYLSESLRDRWTAIRMYGQWESFYVPGSAACTYEWDEALQANWTWDGSLESTASDAENETGNGDVYRKFGFAAVKEQVSREVPLRLLQQVEYPGGTYRYFPIKIAKIDYANGFLWTEAPVIRPTRRDRAVADNVRSPGKAKPPAGVFLQYTAGSAILPGARAPQSGHSGTAHSVYGLENERIVIEENNLDVTADRAWRILRAKCDVIVEGEIVLAGDVPNNLWKLNKRINIARASAKTGWENVGAILASLSHDFQAKRTTLNLSSDKSPWSGEVLQ